MVVFTGQGWEALLGLRNVTRQPLPVVFDVLFQFQSSCVGGLRLACLGDFQWSTVSSTRPSGAGPRPRLEALHWALPWEVLRRVGRAFPPGGLTSLFAKNDPPSASENMAPSDWTLVVFVVRCFSYCSRRSEPFRAHLRAPGRAVAPRHLWRPQPTSVPISQLGPVGLRSRVEPNIYDCAQEAGRLGLESSGPAHRRRRVCEPERGPSQSGGDQGRKKKKKTQANNVYVSQVIVIGSFIFGGRVQRGVSIRREGDRRFLCFGARQTGGWDRDFKDGGASRLFKPSWFKIK